MHIHKALALVLWCASAAVCAPPLARDEFTAQWRALLAREAPGAGQARLIARGAHQLQHRLRARWEGSELFVYGSYPSGLGVETSDVDLFLRIPNYNDTTDAYLVNETAKILYEEPDKYSDIVLHLTSPVPMMTFHSIYMQRDVDLSFRTYAGVVGTELIAYYLKLDPRFKPMANIIKIWCRDRKLTGKGLMPNYSVYLMIIFYLQQKKMAPTVYELQSNLQPYIVDNWNDAFQEVQYKIENHQSMYELLGGFFQYYSEFDFKHYCASPYVGRQIAKSDLADINRVPAELTFYTIHLNIGRKPIPTQSDMCVQDIFKHDENVALRANRDNFLRINDELKFAAKMYSMMPKDQFLKTIL